MNEHKKVKILHYIVIAFALILAFSAFRWQVLSASKFEQIAKARTQDIEIKSMRGSIYAKDGTSLAYSIPTFDMFIWTADLSFFEDKGIQTREEFVNKVAPIINMKPEDLAAKINQYNVTVGNETTLKDQWIPIVKGLTNDQWTKLRNLKSDKYPTKTLSGITFTYSTKRVYPEGRLAAHVIGLTKDTGNNIVGQAGLEETYGVLKEIKGFVTQENDGYNQPIATALVATTEPKNGSSLVTSIDKRVQQLVQDKIKEGVEKYQAKSASVIVMDPKNGQIMALANYPDYDPNRVTQEDVKGLGNLAITSPYEIGSVGKALTISTAIEKGVVNEDTVILPEGHNGCEKISNDLNPICTWDKKPQPPMPLRDCFKNSDNICLYHLALMLNRKDFYDYLTAFGMDKKSGIDLAGESGGYFRPLDDWTIGDVAAYSYGHGYSVNAVTAIEALSTIANFGVRMQPYIVTKVIDADGKVNEYKPVDKGRVISKETAERVTQMMNYNYSAAIAPNEYFYDDLRNYKLAVKSGTALISTQTGYENEINATYVGFDASPQRTFIMLIRLERPEVPADDKLAFYNVRPLWLDTFAAIKDVIGVPRQ